MNNVLLIFLGISITIGYGLNIFAVATPCFYEEIYFDPIENKNATRCHRLNPFSDQGLLFDFNSILIYLTFFCYCIVSCAYWWIFQGILVKKCGYTRQILIVLDCVFFMMLFISLLYVLSILTFKYENGQLTPYIVVFLAPLPILSAHSMVVVMLIKGVKQFGEAFPDETLPPILQQWYSSASQMSNIAQRPSRLEKRSNFEQRLQHLEELNSNLEQRLADLEQDVLDSQERFSDV